MSRPWRERVEDRPALRRAWRVGVAVLGGLVVVVGLIAVPAPGPGWLIVFAGVGIWATEFDWARRLLHWGRGVLGRWTAWIGRQSWWARGLVGLGTLAVVGVAFWGVFAVSGVPGVLPDRVETWLRSVPGLA